MNKQNFTIIFFLLIIISSCSMKVDNNRDNNKEKQNCRLINAVVFQQKAAEYDALVYQAFNIAKQTILNDMKISMLGKKQAIVIDVDETVLDNSPYEAECIIKGINYPEKWDEWINSANAEAVPGALEFLNFAAENRYEIFYVTNRKEKYKEVTIKNLKREGFPFADADHLLMRTNSTNKKERRAKISQNYRIVLLIGDNLDDFSEVFFNKYSSEREVLADSLRNEFGKRFVVLPNAMYGPWEQAIIRNHDEFKSKSVDEILFNSLEGF